MRIKLRPIEPLELEFQDGTVKTALFNNDCFIIYEEEFGELSKNLEEKMQEAPYREISKILYCGLKAVDPNITLDEALEMTYMGGMELVMEIANSVVRNFDIRGNEESKKKFKAMMEKKMDPQEWKELQKAIGI
jgi:hypothetical protein